MSPRNKGPSRTATKIARFMLLIDGLPRLGPLLPTQAAATVEAVMRASGAVPARHLDMMKRPATRRFAAGMERLTGQGQLLWFAIRKRWFADQVGVALQEGARQLLVVGAGFDPLASLVARQHPEVLAVELDAAGTADPKRLGVEGAGLARANHVICSADLSVVSLADALKATPWRSDVPSVVVAEGLLMYLSPADVTSFFASVRACTGAGSRVAYSSLTADERGRPRVGMMDLPVRLLLRLAGEPMKWGLRSADVPAFLQRAGYRVLEQPTTEALRDQLLRPLGLNETPLAPYEYLVLAERQ